MEHYGRLESADRSTFTIKTDGNGEIIPVDKKDAAGGVLKLQIGSRVAFTTSPNGSEVVSLRKCEENEGAMGSGEAAKETDQATKSA